MPATSLELLALFLSLCASALYSGAEAALMSLGVDRAKQLMESGRHSSAYRFLMDRPNEILVTILVGNNLVNIFAASLMTSIATRYFQDDAVGISVGISTVLVLIFGEILPKSFARTHAERLSFPALLYVRFNYYALFPIIKLFSWLIHTFLGANAQLRGRLVTRDDLEFMINKAEKERTMDSKQIELLTSILEFPTIKVKDIMVPRSKVNSIQSSSTFSEIVSLMRISVHSRYPVCDGELDKTLGFLHAKDLAFVRPYERDNFKLEKYLRPPFFVYEHMKIQAVFEHMNRKKLHMAMVKDENGLVVGVITLEDIIEEIMGEIQDEHDSEESSTSQEEQPRPFNEGVTVEGNISLRDLYNDYDIKIPLNDNFSTLAGFLLDMLGNSFPEQGQKIIWQGLSFDLTAVENSEIKEVLIKDVDGDRHYYSKKERTEHEDSEGEGI